MFLQSLQGTEGTPDEDPFYQIKPNTSLKKGGIHNFQLFFVVFI